MAKTEIAKLRTICTKIEALQRGLSKDDWQINENLEAGKAKCFAALAIALDH